MKYMMTYDMMESMRNTNQWLGSTARAMAAYPMMSMTANPMMEWLGAWGTVTERAFSRMVVRPDWNIPVQTASDGTDHIVHIKTVLEKPFGNLIHFNVGGRAPKTRRVLLVAPMSGHYATLVKKTVISLLPDCEVYVTDWHNARDIPVSAGKFDIEDSTLYLVDFMKELGADLHVIAVCQPAPLTLAAVAYLAEEDPKAQPRSMTLIGGPIDPDANPTSVTDFGHSVTMGQLEQSMIQRVGFKFKGVGRQVYPGLLQLSSFIAMNKDLHAKAFRDQIIATAKGEASDHDKHNEFYDEYLSVMDMPAEFYLSTVERVFKNRDIARNDFTVAGKKVDIGKITTVAVKVVEGEKDDISAPGQCLAALALLTGLPDHKKAAHLEPGAGHYGIFAGAKWRKNIRPLVLAFIDANSDAPAKAKAEKPQPAVTKTAAQPTAKAVAAPAARKATTAKAKTTEKPAPAKAAEAPKAVAKPAEAPKPDAKPAEAPNAATVAPKAVAKTAEAPKADTKTAEASKAVEAPKQDAKTAEAPKAETKPTEAPRTAANAPTSAPSKPADNTPAAPKADAAPVDQIGKDAQQTAPSNVTAMVKKTGTDNG